VYPRYETRGDLAGCVEIFKEWYAMNSKNKLDGVDVLKGSKKKLQIWREKPELL